MFSFSQERERMSKEQYRAAQKLFLLEKLNLDPDSEEKFTSIYFETQEKVYNKMMSYRKIKRDLYKNDSADSDECNALIKKMYDIKRDEYNTINLAVFANANTAEDATTNDEHDFMSNGFKMKNTGSSMNASGGTYVYMAFAQNPLKNARRI